MLDECLIDGMHTGHLESLFPQAVCEAYGEVIAENVEAGLYGGRWCTVICAAFTALAAKRRPFIVRPPAETFDINYYHARTGNMCEFLLRESAKSQGLERAETLQICVPCVLVKGKKVSLSKIVGHGAEPGMTFHIDICGRVTSSSRGSVFTLVVVDTYSRFMLVYGLRRKSAVTEGFKLAIAAIAVYHRRVIECVRVGKGGE